MIITIQVDFIIKRHLTQVKSQFLGPTNPDGSVNFECHCVSHIVASPCGHEFRKAMTCQKSATEKELEEGACGEEFMQFLECVISTGCFRSMFKYVSKKF